MAFVKRVSQDLSNAWTDAYGKLVLGDDAGKSARIVLVVPPSTKALPRGSISSRGHPVCGVSSVWQLGMTFCEINGRAYVQYVDPTSLAAQSGILPQDAVQYAAIVNTDDDDDTSWIVRQALQCEAEGTRISYNDLKRLLDSGGQITDPDPLRPPIPSTILCQDRVSSRGSRSSPRARPLVFVMRRTRQRKSSILTPIHFRLDEECDVAASLVQRLAPTADMELPPPDVWDELMHDGTDWLLGKGSMLPPKSASQPTSPPSSHSSSIPLDEWEQSRQAKLANLRSRMAASAMDRTDDVEAATIRGMIQQAVGLAFVRASKVVLGVSLHVGSGICIARLSDGTWSAPCAIGTWGVGLGLQFGLEMADYIFILQTQESLQHFRRGGSFTVGGNVGAAVAGMGREAYGAASVGGVCGSESNLDVLAHEDEYNDDGDEGKHQQQSPTPPSVGIAPIVAYAKSQGLYMGVSLEGSRIFTRDDVNQRAYTFTSGHVNAHDILSGKVPTPPEAEDLYAALHSIEFTHEMSCLPRPPSILRNDSSHPWVSKSATLGGPSSVKNTNKKTDPFPFFSKLSAEEKEECNTFETQFKEFLCGGVSVQRLIPGTRQRERRTLWLMFPGVGSFRLGFVSKLSDEGATTTKNQKKSDDPVDWGTVASEEVTLDSALLEKDTASTLGQQVRTGNVELSSKHSVALTDVTLVSHDPPPDVHFRPEDQTEHLRVLRVQDVSGTVLLFLANNFREAELLLCGLKLLLEGETMRLGVRGGLPLSSYGARPVEGAMSPAAARGFKEIPAQLPSRRRGSSKNSSRHSGYSSSEVEDGESLGEFSLPQITTVPEGWRSWGRVPGRKYMRGQAATYDVSIDDPRVPKYVHGQPIDSSISENILLRRPLPHCRMLLLASSSAVITKWEKDRGDINFETTAWTFPPATPREKENYTSEHQLIASGSMCGAHRTISFERPRNGQFVRLSETQIVESDDSEMLAFTFNERMPRRGFSIKVRLCLKSIGSDSCVANVTAEIRPVGKNMSNQAAVHKAYMLVVDELKARYGVVGVGLLAGFLAYVESMPSSRPGKKSSDNRSPTNFDNNNTKNELSRPFRRTGPPISEEKKEAEPKAVNTSTDSGLVSFEDMLKVGPGMADTTDHFFSVDRPSTPSLHLQTPEADPGKRFRAQQKERKPKSDEFEGQVKSKNSKKPTEDPVMIEVKPLPKIRLSLMPSPREEDEEEEDSANEEPVGKSSKKKKKSSKSSSRKKSGSWRKSSRQRKKGKETS